MGCVIQVVGRHQRLGKIIVVVALSSMQSMLGPVTTVTWLLWIKL